MPHPAGIHTTERQAVRRPGQPGVSRKILPLPRSRVSSADTRPRAATANWAQATQDLLDALPQVWTRAFLYLLMVVAAVSLTWAMLFKIDVTGSAKGRIEPKARLSRVDTPVAGTVTQVLVSLGEKVNIGQPLIALESEALRSELQQAELNLQGQRDRLRQLKLAREQLQIAFRAQEQQSQAQALEKRAQIDQIHQQLTFAKSAFALQQTEKRDQIAQAQQSLVHHRATATLAAGRLTQAIREAQRFRQARHKGVVAEITVLEKEDVVAERHNLHHQAQAALEQATLRLKNLENSYQRLLNEGQSEMKQAQLRLEEQERGYQRVMRSGELEVLRSAEALKVHDRRVTQLQTDIAQSAIKVQALQFQIQQRIIQAPVAGTIFDLPIPRPGVVVQPSDKIADIAPDGSTLILRAQIATVQSGSLQDGLPVKIKFDAYPFQDYGVINGTLTQISPTSTVTATFEGASVTYDLDIELAQSCIPHARDCLPIRPGDTATAEVIVRQRRVIDFVLSPFKKLRASGMKL